MRAAVGLACLGMLVAGGAAHADTIFSDNFNNFSSPNAALTQYATGLNVYYGGTLTNFAGSGGNANLAVDRTGAGDYAVMLYGGAAGMALNSNDYNAIRLITPIDANQLGVTYTVSFDAAPAVFNVDYQRTDAAAGVVNDYIVFQLMDTSGANFANYSFVTPVFTATSTNPANPFSNYSFTYVGNGVGNATLNILGVTAPNEFAGAIDNLVISSPTVAAAAVPEPASLALLGLGFAAVGAVRRRKPI